MRKNLLHFCPVFFLFLGSCMLPSVQKEWDANTLPDLKETAASAGKTVISLVPGIGSALIKDLADLFPGLMKEVGIISEEVASEESSE